MPYWLEGQPPVEELSIQGRKCCDTHLAGFCPLVAFSVGLKYGIRRWYTWLGYPPHAYPLIMFLVDKR